VLIEKATMLDKPITLLLTVSFCLGVASGAAAQTAPVAAIAPATASLRVEPKARAMEPLDLTRSRAAAPDELDQPVNTRHQPTADEVPSSKNSEYQ
jgi:hypothetical protein